jgi:hypothetical protein
MTMVPRQTSTVSRSQRGGTLYDVLDLILDKGLVIDAYIRVSLVGIEILTIDIRVVVASVDTYLRFAEAVNRLDLSSRSQPRTLPEFVGDLEESGASRKTKGALSGAAESVTGAFRRGRERLTERESRSPPESRRSEKGDD